MDRQSSSPAFDQQTHIPKSKVDFMSVMSFVNSPTHTAEHRVNEKDSSLTSPLVIKPIISTSETIIQKNPTFTMSQQIKAPHQKQELSNYPVRHNHVSTVMLHGVSIVSLFIESQERLCLAQISNTLLKEYSYNEIHNRRVALGITCVQCTPVQLEILRRAGAMPISSRRCGMITKREAERLVKSFLEETAPPKLPEDFAFDVYHECGWGGKGNFIPSRYNSSRAKCIKCAYCNMYFSPNKFIFHFHRTPESKYNHPDAANFNSWRRHLKLSNSNPSDELYHIWEDVKAMFNGGSRKRMLSSSCSSTSHKTSPPQVSESKRPKFDKNIQETGMPPIHQSGTPYPQYPVFPMPNKLIPFKPPHGHPAFCMPPPYPALHKVLPHSSREHRMMKPPNVPGFNGLPESMCPPYEMIWAKHLGLSPMENGMILDSRLKSLGNPISQCQDLRRPEDFSPVTRHDSTQDSSTNEDCPTDYSPKRVSAFRRVSNPNNYHHTTEAEQRYSRRDERSPERCPDDSNDSESDLDEHVDVDTIDTDDRDSEENNNISSQKEEQKPLRQQIEEYHETETQCHRSPETLESPHLDNDKSATDEVRAHVLQDLPDNQPVPVNADNDSGMAIERAISEDGKENEREHIHWKPNEQNSHISKLEPNEAQIEDEEIITSRSSSENDPVAVSSDNILHILSKEELQRELLTEMQARKKLEEDCKTIKETFHEQVEREKQFRDEMAQQLQIVREKLCHELDQERKVRFSLQEKLKEAHEALETFSCKPESASPCSDCHTYKEPLMPR